MRYEFGKILGNKILFFFLFAAVGVSLWFSYYVCVLGNFGKGQTVYADKEEYGSYLGPFTEEKCDRLLAKREALEQASGGGESALGEMMEYGRLLSCAQNCREATYYRNNVRENARRLSESERGYYKRLNEKIYRKYGPISGLSIEDNATLENLTILFEASGNADVGFVLALAVFSCCVFLNEHKCGTYYMVKSSYRGSGKTYWDKVGASFLFTVGLSFLQMLSLLSFVFVKGSFGEWKSRIQIGRMFVYSPYDDSVFRMVFFVFLMKTVGYLALMSVFLWVSLFFSKTIVPLAINVLLGLGGMFADYLLSGKFYAGAGGLMGPAKSYELMQKFLPFPLISNGISYLKELKMVNLLGYPVELRTFALVGNTVIAVLCVLAGYLVYDMNFRKNGVR